ncbi:tRNA U34 5-carboxymethylaminomethyl modifying enzyme MnmG/GidA [Deinobacterium chartae]|uniref:tRNA U34 5-carboxymethylaminomethyl modifying enzyme MnmG/GidA n=1 Tax=Deinobacterium chartae TaxID=521158 RepID=A0A841HZP1_9DEIO|nr:FAD-dependent oxidoreductase [Deinobacterium chartae]MBB6098336.1 tRNA U34 5-carboxymethylaminomethyl modifying enzyme MnmG/GidA [Deinobacterium chartae]
MQNSAPRSFPQPGHVYDLAVVGAGLAGSELAWRAAHAGQDVLLVSQSLDTVANLFHSDVPAPFPPTTLLEQARLRALPDTSSWALHRQVKYLLEATPGVHLLQSLVVGIEPGEPLRLATWEGPERLARRVVLAVGSFLRGRLWIGDSEEQAGRLSEVAYDDLADDLERRRVLLGTEQREAPGESGSLPYRVNYRVLPRTPDFALQGLSGVYALGTCTAGEHSYASVLEDAAQLAGELTGVRA